MLLVKFFQNRDKNVCVKLLNPNKTLNEVLPNIRKYVVDSEKFGSWVYELDLKDKLQSDLFENLDVEALNTGK